MSHINTLTRKPEYSRHRYLVTAADTADLAALLTANPNGAINCVGYNTIHGFAEYVAGSTPNISIQPLELVKYVDPAGNEVEELIERGALITGVTAGSTFEVATNGGGRWFMRIAAINGAPTSVSVYLAAGTRANEGSI